MLKTFPKIITKHTLRFWLVVFLFKVFLAKVVSLEMFLEELSINVSSKNTINEFSTLKVIFQIFKNIS